MKEERFSGPAGRGSEGSIASFRVKAHIPSDGSRRTTFKKRGKHSIWLREKWRGDRIEMTNFLALDISETTKEVKREI